MWKKIDESDIPDCLYHYCSIDAFLKIVENKTIRLPNIFKMNDYSEVMHVLDLLPRVLEEEYKRSPFNLTYCGLNNAKAFQEIVSDLKKYAREGRNLSYIACFSQPSHGYTPDTLGQWRAYGDNGAGVAIGFDGKMLKSLVDNFNKAGGKFTITFTNVTYAYDDQQTFLRESCVPQIFDALKSAKVHANVVNGYVPFEHMFLTMTSLPTILVMAAQYKDQAYSDEQEWRLCLDTFIDSAWIEREAKVFSKDSDYGVLTLKKMGFESDGGKVTSHLDICFNNADYSSLIKNIIVGPRAKIRRDDEDLKLLLTVNGFNISVADIKNSDIPYS